MRFYLIVMLPFIITLSFLSQRSRFHGGGKKIPQIENNYILSFKNKVLGRNVWGVVIGDNKLNSPKIKGDFRILLLSFLMGLNGFRLRRLKFLKKFWIVGVLFPNMVIRRYFLFSAMRFLIKRLKINLRKEKIFILVFFISFMLGDFSESSYSFIFSWAIIGSFISLKNYSFSTKFMAILIVHLASAAFFEQPFSLLSPLLCFPLVLLLEVYTYYLYLSVLSFYLFHHNLSAEWVSSLLFKEIHRIASISRYWSIFINEQYFWILFVIFIFYVWYSEIITFWRKSLVPRLRQFEGRSLYYKLVEDLKRYFLNR